MKKYILPMFTYPSGAGLHVGHVSNFAITDIIARMSRMQWHEVIFPTGFDSFGLPTEWYAMKTGKSASVVTAETTQHFRKQLQAADMSFDRERCFNTSDPEYYKRTQRIFAQLFEKGLAYRKDGIVNRCEWCQTVLANDQVVDNRCERCESDIIQKKMPQRYVAVTQYAELLLDYSGCDRPDETVAHQTHRIGKSEGVEIDFDIANTSETITIFTTKPETIYGVTALILAPEYTTIDYLLDITTHTALDALRLQVSKKSALERGDKNIDKLGLDSWLQVLHPLTGQMIPVWYGDFVLAEYATGAVMFVPAHDHRDSDFATKYHLPSIVVLDEHNNYLESTLLHSDKFDHLTVLDARSQIIQSLQELHTWTTKTCYKLRDWSVSRQRYWWSPIPVYYTFEDNASWCYTADHPHPDKSKWIPHLIPDDELPVILPLDLPNYKPAGKSPLEDHPTFKYYHSKDGNTYLRECDTLDTFMCSSFYYLRFLNPTDSGQILNSTTAAALPVDIYVGGKEHTVGHLLYARFIYKFLKDHGYIDCQSNEPFHTLIHQGMVHGSDGRKMSKRRGNVIDPMDVIQQYGSDTLRLYLMFMWPIEHAKNRSDDGIKGIKRFLDKVEKCVEKANTVKDHKKDTNLTSLVHQTILSVTSDLESLKFNTAISKLMILTNAMIASSHVSSAYLTVLLSLLHPFAPQMTQVLRPQLWHTDDIVSHGRPVADPSQIFLSHIDLPIQINGKMKGTLSVALDTPQEEVITLLRASITFAVYMQLPISKIIFVPNKIINIIQ